VNILSKEKQNDVLQQIRADIDITIKDFTRNPYQYLSEYNCRYTNQEIFDNEISLIKTEFDYIYKHLAEYNCDVTELKKLEAEFIRRAKKCAEFREFSHEDTEGRVTVQEAQELLELEQSFEYNNKEYVERLKSYIESKKMLDERKSLKEIMEEIQQVRTRKQKEILQVRIWEQKEIQSRQPREKEAERSF